MNKKGILQLIEENPIILGINKESDLKLAAKAESQVVFTLFGTISNIGDTIHHLKKMKQLVFVNIDMVDGFSPRNSVVDFLKTMELDASSVQNLPFSVTQKNRGSLRFIVFSF